MRNGNRNDHGDGSVGAAASCRDADYAGDAPGRDSEWGVLVWNRRENREVCGVLGVPAQAGRMDQGILGGAIIARICGRQSATCGEGGMSNRNHIKGRASERGVDTRSGLPADRHFTKDAV